MAVLTTCPQCQSPVKAGISICPQCDFILDSGFLTENEPSDFLPANVSMHGEGLPVESPELAEASWRDLIEFYQKLSTADRWSLNGILVAIFGCVFPWTQTRDTEVLGIFGPGLPALLLCIGVVTVLVLRVPPKRIRSGSESLWLIQIAATSLSTLYSLLYLYLFWTKSGLGIGLTVFGGVVALISALGQRKQL